MPLLRLEELEQISGIFRGRSICCVRVRVYVMDQVIFLSLQFY